MFKNTASTFYVFAFDATTNVPKTGDAANLTAYVAIDAGAVTVLGDTTATELDATNAPGYYKFDAAQAETNGDRLLVTGKSSTANIKVIGAPAVIYTRPATGWLAPTTAGRTLDVSAGGEAGVDWANVGSPTTSLALTGTTIATTQKVDVETIKTNPVVNGGTITFPTTATLASTTNITAGTITTATNVTTVNGLAANVITAASMAADASAEIADAVWDEDATAHQTGGTFGQAIGDPGADTTTIYQSVVTDAAGTNVAADIIAMKADTAAILVDTGTTLDGRIPAALVGGRMDASVGAVAAGAITATAIADGAIDAATFAAGAIDAAAVATGAIDADALAADAVTEIWAKAMTELTGPPAANGTVLQALTFLLMALRNARATTATTDIITNDAGATIATATLSDDLTTFTKGEYA